MFNRTIFALLASGTLLAAPPAAQRWGYGPVPSAGACFYQHRTIRDVISVPEPAKSCRPFPMA